MTSGSKSRSAFWARLRSSTACGLVTSPSSPRASRSSEARRSRSSVICVELGAGVAQLALELGDLALGLRGERAHVVGGLDLALELDDPRLQRGELARGAGPGVGALLGLREPRLGLSRAALGVRGRAGLLVGAGRAPLELADLGRELLAALVRELRPAVGLHEPRARPRARAARPPGARR